MTQARGDETADDTAGDAPGTGAARPTPEQRLGRIVARLREQRGWTQAHLTHGLALHGFEMHQTTVAKLESGKRPIRVNELVALADIFGVPVMDLMPGAGEATDRGAHADLIGQVFRARADVREAEQRIEAAEAAMWNAKMDRDQAMRDRDERAARLAELERKLRSHRG